MGLYDIEVKDKRGGLVSLSAYRGKVLLIVNVASKCGFTPQYGQLQSLYATYHEAGFEILGFPCNQFAGQEPGSDEEIQQFCQLNYGVTFPIFAKVDVKGSEMSPLYQYLTEQSKGVLGGGIKWNFTKFLISRDGSVIKRYSPSHAPEKLGAVIEQALKEEK